MENIDAITKEQARRTRNVDNITLKSALSLEKHAKLRTMVFYWLPAFGVLGGICIASSLPATHAAWPRFQHADKVAHFTLFGIFGLTWIRAIYASTRWGRYLCVFLTVVTVLLVGALDEAHQFIVPGRDVDALDVLADGLGGVVAALGWLLLISRNHKTKHDKPDRLHDSVV